MAEILALSGGNPATVGVDTTGGHVTMPTENGANLSRSITIKHTSKFTAGTDGSAAIVAIGHEGIPTAADYSEENDKRLLLTGESITIEEPPAAIYFKASTGDVSVLFIPGALAVKA